jgi:methylthioribose-1-phosphate isomerase
VKKLDVIAQNQDHFRNQGVEIIQKLSILCKHRNQCVIKTVIKTVSEAIASLRPNYVNMYENIEEMHKSAEKMYQIARVPRVISAIDCTLLK